MKDLRIFVASSKELERERNELAFLGLVDRVAECGGLVEAPSEKYVRKITAFLAADEELAEERNAFADTVLNVNDLLEQAHRNIRVQLRFYDPANAESVLEGKLVGGFAVGYRIRRVDKVTGTFHPDNTRSFSCRPTPRTSRAVYEIT